MEYLIYINYFSILLWSLIIMFFILISGTIFIYFTNTTKKENNKKETKLKVKNILSLKEINNGDILHYLGTGYAIEVIQYGNEMCDVKKINSDFNFRINTNYLKTHYTKQKKGQ